eukprot:202062_1
MPSLRERLEPPCEGQHQGRFLQGAQPPWPRVLCGPQLPRGIHAVRGSVAALHHGGCVWTPLRGSSRQPLQYTISHHPNHKRGDPLFTHPLQFFRVQHPPREQAASLLLPRGPRCACRQAGGYPNGQLIL